MVAIAHTDGFSTPGPTNSANCSLDFLIAPLQQDYDELAVVFQYLYAYSAAYELAANNAYKYVQQRIRLSLDVYEVDGIGNQTYKSTLPYNEVLVDYKLQFSTPLGNRPTSQTTQRQPTIKLQNFKIPQAKKICLTASFSTFTPTAGRTTHAYRRKGILI